MAVVREEANIVLEMLNAKQYSDLYHVLTCHIVYRFIVLFLDMLVSDKFKTGCSLCIIYPRAVKAYLIKMDSSLIYLADKSISPSHTRRKFALLCSLNNIKKNPNISEL